MPKLVSIENELPIVEPTSIKEVKPARTSTAKAAKPSGDLGGLNFYDPDAVVTVDESQKFLDKLFKQYPEAVEAKIAPALEQLIINVDSVNPDPLNARLHPENNMRAIMTSLAAYGQMKPIVVRKENMTAMAGNGTLAAFKRLGWNRIAASVVEMTDAEAAGYGLADNRTAELAKWDMKRVELLDTLIREAGKQTVGWSSSELLAIRRVTPPVTAPQIQGMKFKVIIECTDEQQQLQLLAELEGRKIKCQALIS